MAQPISVAPTPITPIEPPEPMLQFFDSAHLPADLAAVSEPFGALARQIVEHLPRNPLSSPVNGCWLDSYSPDPDPTIWPQRRT